MNLVQMSVSAQTLQELANTRKLPGTTDKGYLAHCLLEELFGREGAPRPFDLMGEDVLTMLGYTQYDAEALKSHSQTYTPPELFNACAWNTLAVKAMPTKWSPGQILGFRLRACPTIRRGKRSDTDAYLIIRRDYPNMTQEQTYAKWLDSQFKKLGGAEVAAIDSLTFRYRRVTRRGSRPSRVRGDAPSTHGRESFHFDIPDMIVFGKLKVLDREMFNAQLARGIGRQKAFGFGAILLRSP